MILLLYTKTAEETAFFTKTQRIRNSGKTDGQSPDNCAGCMLRQRPENAEKITILKTQRCTQN